MKFTWIPVCLLVAAATVAARAGVLFDNGAPDPAAGAVASNFAGHDPEYELQSADDFVLATPAMLTQVTWWGAYQDSNIPLQPDVFTIRIFADAGGQPAPTPVVEFRPDRVKRSATGQQSGGFDIYEYTAQFRPHVVLAAGTYWLSVMNDVQVEQTATDWLWILTNATGGNYAYRVNDASGWQLLQPFSLAFEIDGVARSH